MDEVLEKLDKLVSKELDKIVAKGDINPNELEMATKAVCLKEKIKMVEQLTSGDSYSRGSYAMNRRGRSYYGNGNYYGNGGYDNYGGYDRDRSYDYSVDRGYSGHSVKDRMIAQLESTMMDEAQSESERRTIESLISQLSAANR